MTLVCGICRDGKGVLIADTATSIPMTAAEQHPFQEPTLKILAIGDSLVGYAGDTAFLTGLFTPQTAEFGLIAAATTARHIESGCRIDFIVLRQNGQEMVLVTDGKAQLSQRCYIGSQKAYGALRSTLGPPPEEFRDELAELRIKFGELLKSPVDGVAGFPISCTAGDDLGYESSLMLTTGPVELGPPGDDGWRTIPLTDKVGGQFAITLTGLGYEGVCVAYPHIGFGFVFANDDPEPLIVMQGRQWRHRDLSKYDLVSLAGRLEAGGIEVGDTVSVPRTLSLALRELIGEGVVPPR